jgi:hypothetical protein
MIIDECVILLIMKNTTSMKKITISIFCFVLLFASSCRQDEVIGVEMEENILEDVFSVNVSGTIVDLEGNPVENANLEMNGALTSSDENGLFFIKNNTATNLGKYIKVSKSGYFSAGKNVFANVNGDYKIQITLIPLENERIFDATQGINYELNDGSNLSIPANSVGVDGQAYSGPVTIYATHLNPVEDATAYVMPGDLTAIDATDDLVVLRSFGMMGVEMYTSSGEYLDLLEGSNAVLEFPLDPMLQPQAPNQIDLWHFDETKGKWIEEGDAQRVGDTYVANVSHFSWWNCDVPSDFNEVCFDFIDRLGNSLNVNNIYIELIQDGFIIASDYLNDQSGFCRLVPANEIFILNIYSSCGDLLQETEIGPYTEPINVEQIQLLPNESVRVVTVEGLLTKCEGDPVTNGYVRVVENGTINFSEVESDGMYSYQFYTCEEVETFDLNILATDLEDLKQSATDISVTPDVDYYYQDLTVCEEVTVLDPYFEFTDLGGNVFQSNICTARLTAAETIVISEESILGIAGFTTGEFSGNLLGMGGASDVFNATTITVTTYGEVNENIIGTFEGPLGSGEFIAVRVQ